MTSGQKLINELIEALKECAQTYADIGIRLEQARDRMKQRIEALTKANQE